MPPAQRPATRAGQHRDRAARAPIDSAATAYQRRHDPARPGAARPRQRQPHHATRTGANAPATSLRPTAAPRIPPAPAGCPRSDNRSAATGTRAPAPCRPGIHQPTREPAPAPAAALDIETGARRRRPDPGPPPPACPYHGHQHAPSPRRTAPRHARPPGPPAARRRQNRVSCASRQSPAHGQIPTTPTPPAASSPGQASHTSHDSCRADTAPRAPARPARPESQLGPAVRLFRPAWRKENTRSATRRGAQRYQAMFPAKGHLSLFRRAHPIRPRQSCTLIPE